MNTLTGVFAKELRLISNRSTKFGFSFQFYCVNSITHTHAMKILTRGSYLGFQTDSLFYRNLIISKTEYRQKEDQSWHCHENPFFAYFLKGGNKELRNKDEIKCSAGTLLFYKAGEFHCNKDYIAGSRIFHFEIDNNWFAENKLNPENIPHSEINNLTVKNIFINIIREFSIRDELSESSVQSLALYLFNLLARQIDGKKSIPLWKYNFDKIIYEQTTNKQSLANLAKKLRVHPVTLSRQFPKYYNCSFREYLRQLRIEKAISLLGKKSIPISDIAEHCGFSEPSNFIRCFKRQKGITPDAYRKLI
jgi:AraC family transcriptional regulator